MKDSRPINVIATTSSWNEVLKILGTRHPNYYGEGEQGAYYAATKGGMCNFSPIEGVVEYTG